MKTSGRTTWFAAALIGVVLGGFACHGDDIRWNVEGPAAWNDELNWEEELIPSAVFFDVAVFDNGGTAIVNEAVGDVTGLSLSDGTVHIQSGGSLSVIDTEDQFDGEGQSAIGSSGTLRLSHGGAFSTVGFASGGLLHLDISATDTPVIEVENTAQLGGDILANFASDTEFAYGQSRTFLAASEIIGQFDRVALSPTSPRPGRGLGLQVETDGGTASLVVSNLPVLTLDRTSGRAEMTNVVGDPITMTAYSVTSESGLLRPQGWTSLQSQNADGWTEANPREQAVSELNLTASTTLEVDDVLSLGVAYDHTRGVSPREEDIGFQFVTPAGQIREGFVEYTGPANDLVLRVDPEEGLGAIRNLSSFVDPFDITAYSIVSEGGSLSVDGWSSFAESGEAGEGWVEANPRPEALNELNLAGSQLFSTGTSIDLGAIFKPGGLQDLVFEFATADGMLQLGTVEYGPLDLRPPPTGDCNGDGVVDIQDANCTPDELLDDFLAGLNPPSLRGDADGDGTVQFSDFVVLSNNFGNAGVYTEADFDKDGTIQFGDFVILSNSFGQSGGGAVAAVPEPTTGLLAYVALIGWLAIAVRRARD